MRNDQAGEIVFTPPQSPDEIVALMRNLERFINDDALSPLDPLIRFFRRRAADHTGACAQRVKKTPKIFTRRCGV